MLENREATIRKLKAKIDEWNADIDKLAAKARQVKAEKVRMRVMVRFTAIKMD